VAFEGSKCRVALTNEVVKSVRGRLESRERGLTASEFVSSQVLAECLCILDRLRTELRLCRSGLLLRSHKEVDKAGLTLSGQLRSFEFQGLEELLLLALGPEVRDVEAQVEWTVGAEEEQ